MKRTVENMVRPEKKSNHLLLTGIIIGFLGSLILLSGCNTTPNSNEIAERNSHVIGTATAMSPDDPIINDPKITRVRAAQVALRLESTDPSENPAFCTATVLDTGLADLDNNPSTREDVIALVLTINHCIQDTKKYLTIHTNGNVFDASVIDQRKIVAIPNKEEDYPVFLKLRIGEDGKDLIRKHDLNVPLRDGTQVTNETIVSCGFDGAVAFNTMSFATSEQYCDYGTLEKFTLDGFLQVGGMLVGVGHSGAAGIDTNGNIFSVFSMNPENQALDKAYFVPLNGEALRFKVEMMADTHE